MGSFEELSATVVGVSPDSTEKHRKFIAKHSLGITLLSDPDHAMMERFGAWGTKKMYGREVRGVKRSTVLIDPDGRVAHHWPNVRAKGHAAKVREKLAELQA